MLIQLKPVEPISFISKNRHPNVLSIVLAFKRIIMTHRYASSNKIACDTVQGVSSGGGNLMYHQAFIDGTFVRLIIFSLRSSGYKARLSIVCTVCKRLKVMCNICVALQLQTSYNSNCYQFYPHALAYLAKFVANFDLDLEEG